MAFPLAHRLLNDWNPSPESAKILIQEDLRSYESQIRQLHVAIQKSAEALMSWLERFRSSLLRADMSRLEREWLVAAMGLSCSVSPLVEGEGDWMACMKAHAEKQVARIGKWIDDLRIWLDLWNKENSSLEDLFFSYQDLSRRIQTSLVRSIPTESPDLRRLDQEEQDVSFMSFQLSRHHKQMKRALTAWTTLYFHTCGMGQAAQGQAFLDFKDWVQTHPPNMHKKLLLLGIQDVARCSRIMHVFFRLALEESRLGSREQQICWDCLKDERRYAQELGSSILPPPPPPMPREALPRSEVKERKSDVSSHSPLSRRPSELKERKSDVSKRSIPRPRLSRKPTSKPSLSAKAVSEEPVPPAPSRKPSQEEPILFPEDIPEAPPLDVSIPAPKQNRSSEPLDVLSELKTKQEQRLEGGAKPVVRSRPVVVVSDQETKPGDLMTNLRKRLAHRREVTEPDDEDEAAAKEDWD